MTLCSRVLGFIRDIVFANIFGAGLAFDAFAVAFKIPNFFRRLFAEGAFSQAFVPVLTEYRSKKNHDDVIHFISQIMGTLIIIIIFMVIIAELFAPAVVALFAPGFFHDPERFRLTQQMVHITFPYLLFISMTALFGAILNTWHRFALPALTPFLLNVALIVAAYVALFYFHGSIYVLAWGVVAGGVLQLLVPMSYLKRLKLLPRPRVGFNNVGVKRVMKQMIPALFGVSVAQLSILLDNLFASFLPVGSISWLYYSDRLTFLPLGVIGVALSTVVLPHLSKRHTEQSDGEFSMIVDWSIRCVLLFGLPASIGLLLLAGPLLVTMLFHGHYTFYDIRMTRLSLMAFSLGLPAFMAIKILASAFYSCQNIKTPVKIAAIAMIVNVVFNLMLIKALRHAGLALSTSIAAYVNAILLLYFLLRNHYYTPSSGWMRFSGQLVLANVAMIVFLLTLTASLDSWAGWALMQRIVHLSGLLVGAIGVYFLVLWLLGFRLNDIKIERL